MPEKTTGELANEAYEKTKDFLQELRVSKEKNEELEKNLIAAFSSWAQYNQKAIEELDENYLHGNNYNRYVEDAKKLQENATLKPIAKMMVEEDEKIKKSFADKAQEESKKLKAEKKTKIDLGKDDKNNSILNFQGDNLVLVKNFLSKKYGDDFSVSVDSQDASHAQWKINKDVNLTELMKEIEADLIKNKVSKEALILPSEDKIKKVENYTKKTLGNEESSDKKNKWEILSKEAEGRENIRLVEEEKEKEKNLVEKSSTQGSEKRNIGVAVDEKEDHKNNEPSSFRP